MTAVHDGNLDYESSVDPKLAAIVEDSLASELERLFRGRFTFEHTSFIAGVDGDGDPFLNVRITFSGDKATKSDARKFFELTRRVQDRLRETGYIDMSFCPSFNSENGWSGLVSSPA